jgi:hypothetical protein
MGCSHNSYIGLFYGKLKRGSAYLPISVLKTTSSLRWWPPAPKAFLQVKRGLSTKVLLSLGMLKKTLIDEIKILYSDM